MRYQHEMLMHALDDSYLSVFISRYLSYFIVVLVRDRFFVWRLEYCQSILLKYLRNR